MGAGSALRPVWGGARRCVRARHAMGGAVVLLDGGSSWSAGPRRTPRAAGRGSGTRNSDRKLRKFLCRAPCVAYARRARAVKARCIRARMQRRPRCIRAYLHCVCTKTHCVCAANTLRMRVFTLRMRGKYIIAYTRKYIAHARKYIAYARIYISYARIYVA